MSNSWCVGGNPRRKATASEVIGAKPLLLVDIGRDELRWCVALRRGRELSLADARSIPLPVDAQARSQAIRDALGAGVQASGGAHPAVYAALPKNLAFLRVIEAPKVGARDLRKILAVRVAREVPNFAPERMRWDYELVADESGKRLAVLSAIRRDALEAFLEDFRAAGIEPAVVDVEPLAVARWFASHYADGAKTVALVDLGHAHSATALISGGQVRHFGQAPLAFADLASEGGSQRFVLEIKTALHAFNGTEPHPEEIILCGDERARKYLDSGVPMQLGARMAHMGELLPRFEPLIPPGRLGGNTHILESLGWRARQGRRHLTNLLASQRQEKAKRLPALADRVFSLPVVLVLAVVMALALYTMAGSIRERRLALLNESLASIEPLEPQLDWMEDTVQVLKAYEAERFNWLEILSAVNTLKPDTMMLAQLNMDRAGKCSIQGDVNGKTPIQIVEKFVTELNESPLFESAQMGSIRPKQQDVSSFQVSFALAKAKKG